MSNRNVDQYYRMFTKLMKISHKGENIWELLWTQSSYQAKREVFSFAIW